MGEGRSVDMEWLHDEARLWTTLLARAAEEGDVGALEDALSKSAAEPLSHDHDQRTPLMKAAKSGSAPCVERLLPLSAPEATDYHGMTALALCARWGSPQALALLIPKGGCGAVSNDGRTPLMWAAMEGNGGTVRLLLEQGELCLPEAADKDGWTALHWAAKSGCEEVAEALLEACGGCLGVKTAHGMTPYEVALSPLVADRRWAEHFTAMAFARAQRVALESAASAAPGGAEPRRGLRI